MKVNRVWDWVSWACMVVLLGCGVVQCSVSYDRKAMVINGQRRILISGSIHYPRSTPEVLKLQSFSPFLRFLGEIEVALFVNGMHLCVCVCVCALDVGGSS